MGRAIATLGPIALALAAAAAFYPALRWGRRARGVAALGLGLLILATPWAIPAAEPFPRLLAAILCLVLALKLFDLHRAAGRGVRPDGRDYLINLVNPFALVYEKLADEPGRPRWGEVVRLIRGLLGLAAGVAALFVVFRMDWSRRPFAVEHTVKVLACYLCLFLPGAEVGEASFRLLGLRALDFMRHPYLARTPADFWRRYNRPVTQFLHEYAFKPAGGRASPFRGTMAAFAASAAIHEYVFLPAIGRVQGYQTAFFLIQGLAVAATQRVRPRGGEALPAIAATLAFNLTSGVLFFASVDGVVPFYDRGR